MAIGNNIQLYRKKLKLNQSELADFCGINREVISYYENGEREVSLLHLEKIANYMNIELDAFLEEEPQNLKADLALAFRANELSTTDRSNIAHFKTIVKNFLKMKNIESYGA